MKYILLLPAIHTWRYSRGNILRFQHLSCPVRPGRRRVRIQRELHRWNKDLRLLEGYESPTGSMSSLVIMFRFGGDMYLDSSTFGGIKAMGY